MLIRKTVMSLLAPFVFFFAVHCEAQELGKTLWIDQNKDLKVNLISYCSDRAKIVLDIKLT